MHVGLGLRPGTPSLLVSVYYVFADASEVFTSLHHEPVYFSIKRNKAGPSIHGASYWSYLLNEGGL